MKSLLLLSSLCFTLSQCAPYPGSSSSLTNNSQYLSGLPIATRPAGSTQTYQPQGYWDGDGVTGTSKITINRAEQKAYFYKGGQLVGVSPISSGDTEHTTPAGTFKVSQKSINHKSSLYGVIKNVATGETINKNADTRLHKAGPGEVFVNAPMPYFMRFNHGIGMHTGFLPGYPASHGCVRLPDNMAKKFFENAKVGTTVIVK